MFIELVAIRVWRLDALVLELDGLMKELMRHYGCGEELHRRSAWEVRAVFQVFDDRRLEHLLLLNDRIFQRRVLAVVLPQLLLGPSVVHAFLDCL